MESANSHVATRYLQKMKEKLLCNLISILNQFSKNLRPLFKRHKNNFSQNQVLQPSQVWGNLFLDIVMRAYGQAAYTCVLFIVPSKILHSNGEVTIADKGVQHFSVGANGL